MLSQSVRLFGFEQRIWKPTVSKARMKGFSWWEFWHPCGMVRVVLETGKHSKQMPWQPPTGTSSSEDLLFCFFRQPWKEAMVQKWKKSVPLPHLSAPPFRVSG